MAQTTEFMLHLMDEERSQARQSEDQRATLTGLIIIIASAIQGGLTQTGFQKNAFPLTIMLIVLGIFGIMACQKLYERFQFHIHRSRKLRERLEELHPDSQARSLLNLAAQEHFDKYPIIGKKVRLHYIWLALHALITMLGVLYTIIIFLR